MELYLRVISKLSLTELLFLYLGKTFSRFQTRKFQLINNKKNNIESIYRYGSDVKIKDDEAVFMCRIFDNSVRIHVRLSESDVFVFNQIMRGQDYNFVLDVYDRNFKGKPMRIVDAGANIGLTTLFFKCYSKDAQVLAIEPDENNLKMAKLNIEGNSLDKIDIWHAALWFEKTNLVSSNKFGDELSWSIRVKESVDGEIKSITPEETVEYFSNTIDIFKIDIEGAEEKIFENRDWLRNTRLIALEIHDVANYGDRIIDILRAENFQVFFSGELAVAVNNKFNPALGI